VYGSVIFIIQFIKFSIVGLSNTAVNWAIYYALLFFGVYYLIAASVAFIVSVLNAYFWSSRFVFRTNKKNFSQLAKIYSSYGFTFALSIAAMYVMVDIIGLSEYIAPLVTIFITVPLNFLLNKFWVFKSR